MRPILLFCCALSFTACAKGGEQAGGEAATLNLADVAGKWTIQSMAEGSDSVVTHAGPFQSVLRPGVTVSTEGAMRLVNGQLEGWSVAHYQGAGADSVLRIRQRGARTP